MSSPITSKRKNFFDRGLINIHQASSHSHRVEILSDLIGLKIKALCQSDNIKCLDIGCGDMSIISSIAKKNGNIDWIGLDIHPLPEIMKDTPLWQHYRQFDGQRMEFGDNQFDIGIFSDVLHHVPESSRIGLLKEAARSCNAIIIKDHFEYGFYSREMLRIMDFLGNYGYGVSVPKRYFDHASFKNSIAAAGLTVRSLDIGIKLYEQLPILKHILKPQWQFISILSK